ncbi:MULTISPECIES: phosphate ABC transporter permease subunit PstC [unclassified Streptomyces]|uniref:phosphate ABC transporter permease subunit PstC n=1 Tax=unclassified Streptomyces TaxID=2593676 RepID=UPI00226E656D|nr:MULTISPECIES: phosphate ABC transporter permease subunit PstC [unclassified Streptomyces]MCY0921011.1 phosphate ABC transporter permease subunit PstC [Streptomyces sp. H27-G5]MCY0962272.1 phosphate ABC transporter permease subunit PstC [Streptomyces sp. H27-H5]
MASTTPTQIDTAPPVSRSERSTGRAGDKIFAGLSKGSGIALLVIMASIAAFLTYRATIALSKNEGNFFTTFDWNASATPPVFGIAVLLFGTVVSSIIAMVIAVPIAVGIALFISHYAPRKLATPLAYVVDLLAAVPSIVYGIWGALFLVPQLGGLNLWLDQYLGWTYIFDKSQPGVARSLFTVGILLAIMILPIVTSVSREVFLQVPRMNEEAALALGATRWEVIRMSVLPFGRSGVISASMLGLGRALGETMAVATVLSPSFLISGHILDPGGGTFAQNIAAKFDEANEFGRDALIASGLVLFLLTLLVNGAARLIIARRKDFSGANA